MPHDNISTTKYVLEDMIKDKHTWFIIWLENDKMIGTIDLTPMKRDLSLNLLFMNLVIVFMMLIGARELR